MSITGAGALDRQITLQSPSTTRDPVEGDLVPGWATVEAGVWARLTERQVSESGQADQRTTMTRSTTLRVRHRTDVLPTWRVVLDDGRTLQIIGTLTIGRREWLDIMCTEVTGG